MHYYLLQKFITDDQVTITLLKLSKCRRKQQSEIFLKVYTYLFKKKAATLIMYKGTLHGLIQSYYIYNNINIYIYIQGGREETHVFQSHITSHILMINYNHIK